jgi:hypothetical protein
MGGTLLSAAFVGRDWEHGHVLLAAGIDVGYQAFWLARTGSAP